MFAAQTHPDIGIPQNPSSKAVIAGAIHAAALASNQVAENNDRTANAGNGNGSGEYQVKRLRS
jgi:hypothetical protein